MTLALLTAFAFHFCSFVARATTVWTGANGSQNPGVFEQPRFARPARHRCGDGGGGGGGVYLCI